MSPNFLIEVGRILYPEMSDQDIQGTIQEIRRENPDVTDEDIVLGVLQYFMTEDR